MIGIGSLLGLGWVLIAFTTVRAMQSDASIFSRTVGLAIPVALALTLFAGAAGIVLYGLESQAFRISAWTCLGGFAVSIAVVLNILGLEFVRPDFTLALYMITTAAAGGAVLGFLIGLYDAHQKRSQANLATKRDEAQMLSQRLSVLNRVLRHDIRTQAQLIQSYTDRMVADDLPMEPAAEGIEEANRRLTTLSEEARQLQTLLDGSELDSETADLVTTVRDAGESVQAEHGSLTIAYETPERMLVQAPPMLTQAVEHLLRNVVEHAAEDEPRAEVSVSASPSGRSARLTVTDYGPGIPERELIHNTGESESPLRHSEGMGLWLVTWVVEEIDGEMEIETPPSGEVGTVVRITLPRPPER
ncbi:MAG: HAMP domain-containing sensor histidine kinase [Haloarculaceae archaeon]